MGEMAIAGAAEKATTGTITVSIPDNAQRTVGVFFTFFPFWSDFRNIAAGSPGPAVFNTSGHLGSPSVFTSWRSAVGRVI